MGRRTARAALRAHLAKQGAQKRFADEIGASYGSVSLWLSGARLPALPSALRIQAATGGAVKVTDWPHLRAMVLSVRNRVA